MLLDISGNTFSSFGNTAPTVIYTPQQIFGTGLTIWYDFNDANSLYTDSAATTNVVNTGDYILYVKNKAQSRPLYDLRKNISSNQPLSAYSATNDSVLIFNKASLNTNKNSEYIYHNGTVNGVSTPFFSISGYSTTGKSAVTWSGVFRIVTANTATIQTSFQSNTFIILFTNVNNTSVSISNTVTTYATIPINITKLNGYFCATITIDENKNGIIYLNDKRVTTTGFSGITYPILASTNTFAPHYRQGSSYSVRDNLYSGMAEFCFNDSQILTDDQVFKLHQYYRIKYNLSFS